MEYIFTCLHCNEPFIIAHQEFNCRILRHGVYKHNLQPINPHATKDECDALVRGGAIFGCGGPLQIVEATNTTAVGRYHIIICGYI